MSGFHIISADVATTLSAHRIVAAITGTAKSVQYPPSVTALPVGITTDTVLDTTNAIPVQINGPAFCFFNDTVAAGELVTSDTSGRAVPFALAATSTAISAPASYAGIVWGASVANTGAIAHVLLHPGFDRRSV